MHVRVGGWVGVVGGLRCVPVPVRVRGLRERVCASVFARMCACRRDVHTGIPSDQLAHVGEYDVVPRPQPHRLLVGLREHVARLDNPRRSHGARVVERLARPGDIARVEQPRSCGAKHHVERKVRVHHRGHAVRANALLRARGEVRERAAGVADDAKLAPLPEPEARYIVVVEVLGALCIVPGAAACAALARRVAAVLAPDKKRRVVHVHEHDHRPRGLVLRPGTGPARAQHRQREQHAREPHLACRTGHF